MKLKLKIFLILGVVLLGGCQSAVRFTSKAGKSYSAPTNKENKSKSYTVDKSEFDGNDLRKDILSEARRWVGIPYCFGGDTKNCTDCSGFVKEIYLKFGIVLPRTAAEQFSFTEKINFKNKKIGDLIFFSKSRGISHVGIYAGNNCIIHASSSQGVVLQSLDDGYLHSTYAATGRIIEN